jgi:hypothetical protein
MYPASIGLIGSSCALLMQLSPAVLGLSRQCVVILTCCSGAVCCCAAMCAGDGLTVASDGRRVSSRVHRKPLEWYRNERMEYTRQHKSE